MTSQKGIDTDCFPVLSSASVCRGNPSLYCQSAVSTAGSMPGGSSDFTSPTPLPAYLVTCGEGQWFSWLVPRSQLTVPSDRPAEASKLWFGQSNCCPQQVSVPKKAVQSGAIDTLVPHFLKPHMSFLLFPEWTGVPSSFSSRETAFSHTGCQHSRPVLDPALHSVNTGGHGTIEKIGGRQEQEKKHFEFSKQVAHRHLSLLTFDSL